jgi:hypothetical protein
MHPDRNDDLASRIAEALASMPDVELGWLFGSRAAGRARPESDIDVGVEVTAAAAAHKRETLARLFDRLGRVAPSDRLDVVLLNDAPSLLRHRVLAGGRLLFARRPEARVRFATRTIRDYQDMQVRRAFFYRERLKHLKEGKGHGRSGDLLAQARDASRLLGEARGLPRDD